MIQLDVAASKDGKSHLSAEKAQVVAPQWVAVDPDGSKHFTFDGFEAYVVEAIRALIAENNALEQQILQLEIRSAQSPTPSSSQ